MRYFYIDVHMKIYFHIKTNEKLVKTQTKFKKFQSFILFDTASVSSIRLRQFITQISCLTPTCFIID